MRDLDGLDVRDALAQRQQVALFLDVRDDGPVQRWVVRPQPPATGERDGQQYRRRDGQCPDTARLVERLVQYQARVQFRRHVDVQRLGEAFFESRLLSRETGARRAFVFMPEQIRVL